MSIKSALSVRPSRSARALLLAAAAAPFLCAASSADAAFSFGVHVITSKLSIWITIGNGTASGVSPAGDAGHISAMETATVPPGLSMAMADVQLPDFGGSPTPALRGDELTMAMTSLDVLGGLGSPVASAASWGIWITGRSWGVHIIINSSATQHALAGMNSYGTLRYASFPGASYLADVEYINPDGVSSFEQQPTSLLDFDAPAPLPTPGAAALMGLGGLAAFRRRR